MSEADDRYLKFRSRIFIRTKPQYDRKKRSYFKPDRHRYTKTQEQIEQEQLHVAAQSKCVICGEEAECSTLYIEPLTLRESFRGVCLKHRDVTPPGSLIQEEESLEPLFQ